MEYSYGIVYSETALAHLEQIKASGRKNMLKKIHSLIDEIKKDPKAGLGHPKPLTGHGGHVWSRKINSGDRLVYQIHEAERMVTIDRALGHYGDR